MENTAVRRIEGFFLLYKATLRPMPLAGRLSVMNNGKVSSQLRCRLAYKVVSGGLDEDRLLIARDGERVLLVVTDGAGGTGSGAEAATYICDAVGTAFREPKHDPAQWAQTLTTIDQELFRSGLGGESTAVVVELSVGIVIMGASVGDSMAWHVDSKHFDDLTVRQIKKPLVGSGHANPVGFYRRIAEGRLILATDGLTKYCPPKELWRLSLSEPLEDVAVKLIERVRLRYGSLPDDVAVIVCE